LQPVSGFMASEFQAACRNRLLRPRQQENAPMASSGNLKEIYIAEMRDLWSANDQMQQLMKDMSEKASDKRLKDLLAQSVTGIGKHTETLKSVLEGAGGSVGKERCRGMEGLVAEAKKHALDEELEPSLRDLVIIAQYQRMSHYGLAGFGTAAAYADALGEKDGATKLKSIVKDIYKADEYTSQLAERAEKAAAKAV
jgi:ferritin-like metal-binding protein YciE